MQIASKIVAEAEAVGANVGHYQREYALCALASLYQSLLLEVRDARLLDMIWLQTLQVAETAPRAFWMSASPADLLGERLPLYLSGPDGPASALHAAAIFAMLLNPPRRKSAVALKEGLVWARRLASLRAFVRRVLTTHQITWQIHR